MAETSTSLKSERLLLRPWRQEDQAVFAQMNADQSVMKFFPACLSREESDALAERLQGHIDDHDWGMWALQSLETSRFMGFVGLAVVPYSLPFDCVNKPPVEIGWRLASEYWNRGYASEAAQAALNFAFEQLELKEVISFTSLDNKASQSVMSKIGMTQVQIFKHPNLPITHTLSEHVLFRKMRPSA